MTRNPFFRPGIAGAFVTLALIATACGGSTKTATATTTTPTTAAGAGAGGNAAARLAAFRTCMQQKGITLPANFRLGGGRGFGGGGGAGATGTTSSTLTAPTTTIPAGVTPQQWQAALTACASSFRPNPQNTQAIQIYVNCLNSYLSAHGGTTLPTNPGGAAAGLFGGRGGASGDTTTTNPTLQAAEAHCAALRPALGGRGTTTTSIG
jgi:hypothetical protein